MITFFKKHMHRLIAFMGCCSLAAFNAHSQDPIITQYINNQNLVNPAFTGLRNSWATDFHVRQQWLGVEGAPVTYVVNSHSPINKSMASVGAMVMSDVAGPLKTQQFNLLYSYLVRVRSNIFLSLGVNGGMQLSSIGTNDILVLDPDDPYFGVEAQKQMQPRVGVGALIFSPKVYFSFSFPQLYSNVSSSSDEYFKTYHYKSRYVSAGYTHVISRKHSFKGSVMARFNDADQKAIDLNVQYLYRRVFWAGLSYRLQQSVSMLVNLQMTDNWGICYSYDFPLYSGSQVRQGSHEITLSYDCFQFYKKNRNRQFIKKKQDDDELKSIRYF